jgi:hypothetical protein
MTAPKPVCPAAEEHKPSQADEAHIATAGYWREQNEGVNRMAELKALRLAQEARAKPPKPRARPRRAGHRKTHGFGRWS